MGVDTTAKFVPGHGTLFSADAAAAFPANPLAAFTLTGTPPAGWTNVGHTSKDNTAAFTRDGGDKTVLDSWLADGIDVIYASTQYGLTINPIQVDEDSLDLAFDGFFDSDGGYVVPGANNGITKQLFLLATDGTGKLGFYMANTSISIGDAPSIDPAKFFEIPLAASILAADTSKIPAKADGTPGIMKIYKSGLVAAAPIIETVAPTSAVHAAGGMFELVGDGFTGVTGAGGVKFGTTNVGAGNYIVVDDSHITGIIPVAATAGSQPVTATNPNGTSNAVGFTLT